MLDRSRFNKDEGCNILPSKLASNDGHPHLHAFYEWINPVIDQGSGAYQFRTGDKRHKNSNCRYPRKD
jgi:hypothetical protein